MTDEFLRQADSAITHSVNLLYQLTHPLPITEVQPHLPETLESCGYDKVEAMKLYLQLHEVLDTLWKMSDSLRRHISESEVDISQNDKNGINKVRVYE